MATLRSGASSAEEGWSELSGMLGAETLSLSEDGAKLCKISLQSADHLSKASAFTFSFHNTAMPRWLDTGGVLAAKMR